MSDGNPLIIAIREFFGPLIKQTTKLPAPLAYGSAFVIAVLVIVLLGAAIPDNLVWLLGIVTLACLVAFVFADWDQRRQQTHRQEPVADTPTATSPDNSIRDVPLVGMKFDDRIEIVQSNLDDLHRQYVTSNSVIPLRALLSTLRDLFKRNTFEESFWDCEDEAWHERFCAGIQTEHILRVYWDYVRDGASIGEDALVKSYEEVQTEINRYCQAMTGLFRPPPPAVGYARREFLNGNINELRTRLEEERITPKSEISERIIDRCEQHRQRIYQEVQTWPLR